MAQPNVVFIMSDQHRFDCLGCNGHPQIHTPHLDALCRSGVNFTSAFCPAPICSPARASLLTGVWPTEHGVITNWDNSEVSRGIRPDLPTFSHVLHSAGYWMGYVGKWHVDPHRDPRDFWFDAYTPSSGYGPWRRERGFPALPRENGWFGETDPFIRPSESRLAWEADAVIGYLRAQAGKGQPFFLRWDPQAPHLPNIVPAPFVSMYPTGGIPPWNNWLDPLVGKPYIQAQQQRTWKVDRFTWADWAPIVSRYLGEISLLDQEIGRVLSALREFGLEDQTVVVYTSDHGDMCGSHGMMDKMYVMYEEVVRVPLLVRWPNHVAPQECGAFVSNALDLAHTFCELAGAPVPSTFRGQDLFAVLGGSAPPREDIFAMFQGNQFGLFSQRMVRGRQWKYVWNPTSEDELYDLVEDPGELTNRASDARCGHVLRQMRGRLVEWMEAIKDPLLNEWTRTQLRESLKV